MQCAVEIAMNRHEIGAEQDQCDKPAAIVEHLLGIGVAPNTKERERAFPELRSRLIGVRLVVNEPVKLMLARAVTPAIGAAKI
jgi:hypothetical protein